MKISGHIADSFAIKGDIIYSEGADSVRLLSQGWLICLNGKSGGAYEELPEAYKALPVLDYSGRLVLPGLVDLHTHAPQYAFRSVGMDCELIEWLERRAFPEEAGYASLAYAQKAYALFAGEMRNGFTTRACVFGTMHAQATGLLMELLEATGICAMVGKVNMDRNSPDNLRETTEGSLQATRDWLSAVQGRFNNIAPIVTPRFIPSCTDALLRGLARICAEEGVPLQSHLSENLSEIDWVAELVPEAEGYADAYRRFGMFGGPIPTVMAHAVHLTAAEMALVEEAGVYLAHCPISNANLASGIAPVRTYLDKGLRVGLGTDVAGGDTMSVFRAMAEAVRQSKLRWRLADSKVGFVCADEAFYMGTKGGGSFFGKVGSFEAGYELDALVIDDGALKSPHELTLRDRFERLIYLSEHAVLVDKFCRGRRIDLAGQDMRVTP